MAHAINLNAYADYAEQPGIFARLRRAVADHRAYRAIYDELNALTDRELADLDLSRLNLATSPGRRSTAADRGAAGCRRPAERLRRDAGPGPGLRRALSSS